MSYAIIRKNHSGGSVGVSLWGDGKPVYCYDRELTLLFVKRHDAERYLNFAKAKLPTLEGQTDWKVIEFSKQK